MLLKTNTQKDITLSDLISKGGEGEVFNIKYKSSSCAKIYYSNFRTKEREDKIKYMIENPPKDINGGFFKICWPEDILYENGSFVGFTMSKAFNDSTLPYHLCQPNIPKNLDKKWHNIFSRNSNSGKLARIKLCVNIAAAIARIHDTNKYVFVDLKPQNVLITIDGKVSIIDLDSCQVNDGNKLLFSAPVSTPEYTPQEAKDIKFGQDIIDKNWDVFSYAVMTYEILCGIHPFVGTAKPPNDNLTTIQEKINNGISHVLIGESQFSVLPPPHKNFNEIPLALRNTLKTCFGEAKKRASIESLGAAGFKTVEEYNKKLEAELKQKREQENKIAISQYPIVKSHNERLKKEIEQHKQTILSLKKDLPPKKPPVVPPNTGESNRSPAGFIAVITILAILSIGAITQCSEKKNENISLKSEMYDLKRNTKELESENEKLAEKYNNYIENSKTIKVNSVRIGSRKRNNEEVIDYLDNLSELLWQDMHYIRLYIDFDRLRKRSTLLHIKIYNSKSMLKLSDSHYSTIDKYFNTNKPNSNGTYPIICYLGYWDDLKDINGNKKSKGKHTIEIWEKENLLFSKIIHITD